MPNNICTGTGIDADIEDYTKLCQECIKRSQVAKEPLQPHDIPEGPWRKLGIDYFAFNGNSYVLICDYFSKFPFLYRAKTSFWSLRDRLIDLFSIEGYPDEIVSDNGPPFQSKEFAKIRHQAHHLITRVSPSIQTSESHNCHPVTLNLPVRSLYQRPPLASLQCLCPVTHLTAQAQRAPVQVAPIAVHLRHHLRAAHSCLPMLRAQRQAVQPVHHGLHHPNCLRWSTLSTACLRAQEIIKAIK